MKRFIRKSFPEHFRKRIKIARELLWKNAIAWNEAYILRAFLEYNANFKIVLFNTYLETVFSEELKERFPLIFKNLGGSIWIKKEKLKV